MDTLTGNDVRRIAVAVCDEMERREAEKTARMVDAHKELWRRRIRQRVSDRVPFDTAVRSFPMDGITSADVESLRAELAG